MRLILPEKDIHAAYPTYDACSALIFGACFLSIVGEPHGPFRICRSTVPLRHFKDLAKSTHLDLRLWGLSRLPVGVERDVENKLRMIMRDSEIKHSWFDIELPVAWKAVRFANPLAPEIDLKGATIAEILAIKDDTWRNKGVVPLDKAKNGA